MKLVWKERDLKLFDRALSFLSLIALRNF